MPDADTGERVGPVLVFVLRGGASPTVDDGDS
jgi:hypothetical protein